MATYTVTHVRLEWSDQGGRHQHVRGVCTMGSGYYARKEVVDSISTGNEWRTFADGDYARIRPVASCNHPGCEATPYITTGADATAANNLDNLPAC
jgi:Protein of unknown function (DUF3892)